MAAGAWSGERPSNTACAWRTASSWARRGGNRCRGVRGILLGAEHVVARGAAEAVARRGLPGAILAQRDQPSVTASTCSCSDAALIVATTTLVASARRVDSNCSACS